MEVIISVYFFRRRNRICRWACLQEGDAAEARRWWRCCRGQVMKMQDFAQKALSSHSSAFTQPYLTASSLVKCVNLWYLSCFYSHNNSHAMSDLGLSSDETHLKNLALFWLKCIKWKSLLGKITTSWKIIIMLKSLSLSAYWVLKLEGACPAGISVRLISLLYFLFTFHPPVRSRHFP